MVKPKTLLIIGLSLITAAVAFFYFFQSDAAQIKNQLAKLEEAVEKSGSESEISAGIAARRISAVFAESCRVNAPHRGISRTFTPGDIAAYARGARRRYARIDMDFHDIGIEFPEEKTAAVSFTAEISTGQSGAEPAEEIHEIAAGMKKIENEWVFDKIDVVAVLER